MKNLVFKRVVLLSDSQKSANQFIFQKKYNLITGQDNSAGKSTLVKVLLWTLGCKPKFKKSWQDLDIKALVECDIAGDTYSFYRYHDSIKVSKNRGSYKKFDHIMGDYADFFAALVQFHALLPRKLSVNEIEPELQTPPPSFYFTPFYMDQKKGWSSPWNNFEDLPMFSKWKTTIVKYHTGYLSPKHFDIERDIYGQKKIEKIAEHEIKRIDTALAVVDEYVPKTEFTINEGELTKITNEVQVTLQDLSQEQEVILDHLSKLTSEKYHLRKQLDLLYEAIREHEEDYTFSVENIEGDDLECPLCGTHYDNTIISKAEILADKKQLEKQANAIKLQLVPTERSIVELNANLENIKIRIHNINKKYSLEDSNGSTANLSNIIDSLASTAIQRSVNNTKTTKLSVVHTAKEAQKKLQKEQKKLLSKEKLEEKNGHFRNYLEQYIGSLSATGINLEGVKSPTDYSKVLRDGGEAENTRAILAYQASVLEMIHTYGAEILAPFIVDTPNQQEQNNSNYERIVDLILNQIPQEQQVFLCALDHSLIKLYKEKAEVIYLNEDDKLLNKKSYDAIRAELKEIITLQ